MANLFKKCLVVLLLVSAFSVLVITPSHATSPPSSGLQLWWKFDENTDASAADSSGNGNTGTLGSTATWVTGHVNYATHYPGNTNGYTTTSGTGSLDISGNAVSICAWFKTTSTLNDRAIATKGNWESGQYALHVTSAGTKVSFYLTASGIVESNFANANNGFWHNYCGVYDGSLGSDQQKLYVDNALDATGTFTGALGSNAHDFMVGMRPNTDAILVGDVDEVLVYNRALSANEVNAIYNYGQSETTTATQPTSTVTTTTTSTVSTTIVSTVTSPTTFTATSTVTSPTTTTSTVTSPTTTTATVTSTTTSTAISPTTVTHTSTSTVTSPVTTTSTRTVTSDHTSTVTSMVTTTVTVFSATTTHVFERNVTIDTNSTLNGWVLVPVSGSAFEVNVTVYGPAETVGHMQLIILKALIDGTPMVLIDNEGGAYLSETISSNSTHWILDIWYMHSLHTISIVGSNSIPEFPTSLLPMLGLSLGLPLLALRRRKAPQLGDSL